ncbi:hypothetical protein GO684_00455 [Wolbachia endosymbiont of Litomosoides brasiliensis]|uniref:hypothetical protein n=1 Tax=Wolbachia endosymbiont of Litomosoides brasiliensis TaxID=1812117 RepID=UPI00158ED3BD|nr:hypothetical protein [Wolbachia endosymbiont of Litomosoides brasiliensis]NUY39219.1 hypothetical protein [Wolbachia endosymbiont of Litomosoides brasiliensis]
MLAFRYLTKVNSFLLLVHQIRQLKFLLIIGQAVIVGIVPAAIAINDNPTRDVMLKYRTLFNIFPCY